LEACRALAGDALLPAGAAAAEDCAAALAGDALLPAGAAPRKMTTVAYRAIKPNNGKWEKPLTHGADAIRRESIRFDPQNIQINLDLDTKGIRP